MDGVFTRNLITHSRMWKENRNQTITLPEDCKVELRQNELTTDINLYVDFVTQAYDWRFDGNIFKDSFSNDTELLESIQRIAVQRSKFGLTDLKYFKHNYERVLYSVDGIWDKIMNLDFISWFDSPSV